MIDQWLGQLGADLSRLMLDWWPGGIGLLIFRNRPTDVLAKQVSDVRSATHETNHNSTQPSLLWLCLRSDAVCCATLLLIAATAVHSGGRLLPR
jgi:ribose 5-phosphate isomerase RpiB